MATTIESSRLQPPSRLGLRGLLANASARNIARVLRTRIPDEESSGVSMFGHGQDTRIRHSTFNTTVHYHYATAGDTEDVPPAGSGPSNDNREPSSHLEDGSAASGGVANGRPQAPRNALDVYIDVMLTKGRGFPLWIPSPNMSLPLAYKLHGVSIGDVGIITPEGAFDFIFNLFCDAHHPIHAHSVLPTTFTPLVPGLRHWEIQRFKENVAGTMIGDDSWRRDDDFRRHDGPPQSNISTSRQEAAALMMPEDVFVVKVQSPGRLREFVSANIESWYLFVRRILGRDIENGDLRVVYGFRKSTAFGMASVSTTNKESVTRLTFSSSDRWDHHSGYKYRWSHTGSAAKVKTGPEFGESAELMHPAYGASTTIPENQCLFVNTLDAKLSDKVWSRLTEQFKIKSPGNEHVTHSQRLSLSESSGSAPSMLPSNGNTGGKVSSNENTTADAGDLPAFNMVFKRSLHPSAILNDVLLELNPAARVSVICDDDWGSVWIEPVIKVSGPLNFVERVLRGRGIAIKQGVTYIHHPLLRWDPTTRDFSQSLDSRKYDDRPLPDYRWPAQPDENCTFAGKYIIESAPVLEGPFGRVKIVRHQDTHASFAIKVIKKHKMLRTGSNMYFTKQLVHLLHFDHPSLSFILEGFMGNTALSLVSERVEGCTLDTYLHKMPQGLDEAKAKAITYQICDALDYIHGKDIIHSNLKPGNIFIVSENSFVHVKLTDYGMNLFIDPEELMTAACSPGPCFVNAIVHHQFFEKVIDNYMLAVVVFFMFCKEFPFTKSFHVHKDGLGPDGPIINNVDWSRLQNGNVRRGISVAGVNFMEDLFKSAPGILEAPIGSTLLTNSRWFRSTTSNGRRVLGGRVKIPTHTIAF